MSSSLEIEERPKALALSGGHLGSATYRNLVPGDVVDREWRARELWRFFGDVRFSRSRAWLHTSRAWLVAGTVLRGRGRGRRGAAGVIAWSVASSAVLSGSPVIAIMVGSSSHASRRNLEWATVQYLFRIARAAATVAISKRRRSMPQRTVRFSAVHALGYVGPQRECCCVLTGCNPPQLCGSPSGSG